MSIFHVSNVHPGVRVKGARSNAFRLRDQIESAIDACDEVTLDFAGTNPTQSFLDELVGVLVLTHGNTVLNHITFANCTKETRTILHFVISDRLDQRNCVPA